MLTGDKNYGKETMSLGGKLSMTKRWKDEAERRQQGLKTKGGKNKRKCLKHQKDKIR